MYLVRERELEGIDGRELNWRELRGTDTSLPENKE